MEGENRERLDRAALLDGLQRLGLTHMAHVAEHRAEEAAATSAGYLSFYRLVEEELAVRFQRYVETRTRLANFPFRKTLEQFDFDAQPGVDKRAIMELSSMSFVERATNVILLGPPGVGKTTWPWGWAWRPSSAATASTLSALQT